jgi:hypothetical protein
MSMSLAVKQACSQASPLILQVILDSQSSGVAARELQSISWHFHAPFGSGRPQLQRCGKQFISSQIDSQGTSSHAQDGVSH